MCNLEVSDLHSSLKKLRIETNADSDVAKTETDIYEVVFSTPCGQLIII